jgi:hypothetical protein
VPVEVLATALETELSPEKAAKLYGVSLGVIRQAADFQRKLAA